MSLNQRVTAEFSTCTPSAPPTPDFSIQTIRELVTIRTSSVDPGSLDVLRLIRSRFFAVIQRADWSSSFTDLSISAVWWMLNVRGSA
jgi:hypothetical protein